MEATSVSYCFFKQNNCRKVIKKRKYTYSLERRYLQTVIRKYKTYGIVLGLLLVVIGITALALQLVGVQWTFLQFLEAPGRLFSFVVKLIMVMAGFIILVVANTDWERERRECEGP